MKSEASGTVFLETLCCGIAFAMAYMNKVEGSYVMSFMAFIIGARYKAPQLSSGSLSATFGNIRNSIFPRKFSLRPGGPREADFPRKDPEDS